MKTKSIAMSKIFLVLSISLIANGGLSQDNDKTNSNEYKNDISTNLAWIFSANGGQTASTNYYGRWYLQYRRQFKPNWRGKIDISTRNIATFSGNSFTYAAPYDTVRTRRDYITYYDQTTLRIGVERDMFNGFFTVGGNIIGGFLERHQNNTQYQEKRDSASGFWDGSCAHRPGVASDCDLWTYTNTYRLIGASATFNVNLRLSNRLGVTFVYEPQYLRHVDRGITEVHLLEGRIPVRYDNSQKHSFNEFRHNFDLLLRYRF